MTHLPTPAELPQADVVIYDGQCQFCQKQVARLAKWDGHDRLAFLSLHDPQARDYCPEWTHEQLMEQMVVVDRHGGEHAGANAIRYLSRRLPSMWPLTPLLHIPFSMPVWQWLYRQVAIRRYRWNKSECADGACKIHYH
jgi:predicted DCC family thiol-disulfide oxidoreductase YuxK